MTAEPWDEVPAGPVGGAFLELARLEEVEPGLADRQELLRLPASGGRPSVSSLRRGPPWVLNESAQPPRRAVITAIPRATTR